MLEVVVRNLKVGDMVMDTSTSGLASERGSESPSSASSCSGTEEGAGGVGGGV